MRAPSSSASRSRSRPGCGCSTACPSCPGTSSRRRSTPAQFQSRLARRRSRSADVVGLGPFTLVEHVAGTTARLRAQPALLPARRGRRPAALPRSPDARRRARSEHRGAAARSRRDRPDEQRRHPAPGPRRLQAARRPGPPAHDRRERRARSGLPVVQPAAGGGSAARRAPWMARKEFRQAISCGVDRQAIVNTVYLGAAAPLYGPITPGNRRWHSAAAPRLHDCDRERAPGSSSRPRA